MKKKPKNYFMGKESLVKQWTYLNKIAVGLFSFLNLVQQCINRRAGTYSYLKSAKFICKRRALYVISMDGNNSSYISRINIKI